MFTTFIVQPIFNLLVLIYALIPGHNFGLSIILFTIVIRLLMWPLVKKQLHQAKAMRKLQPEMKKIKQKATNRQQESAMLMELYKERGINPFGQLGIVLVQLPILFGLYSGLNRLISDPGAILSFTYPALRELSWMQKLAADINLFDASLFGWVDLTRAAFQGGTIYLPALAIVFGSAVAQYYQSKQLLPADKEGRKLRDILRETGSGKQADQAEVSAAVGRSTRYLLPAMIFFITLGIASALSLYWFISGAVAYIQQKFILEQDEEELEAIASKPAEGKEVIEGEVVKNSSKKPKTNKKRKKRKR